MFAAKLNIKQTTPLSYTARGELFHTKAFQVLLFWTAKEKLKTCFPNRKNNLVLGWPKNTHISFSPITSIWIFWACWLSPMWYNDCSQLMSQFDCYQLQLVYLTMEHRRMRNLQHKASQSTFGMFDQSEHLLHTLHKSFFAFKYLFTFLEIIKHTMLKMLCIFFHLQY